MNYIILYIRIMQRKAYVAKYDDNNIMNALLHIK